MSGSARLRIGLRARSVAAAPVLLVALSSAAAASPDTPASHASASPSGEAPPAGSASPPEPAGPPALPPTVDPPPALERPPPFDDEAERDRPPSVDLPRIRRLDAGGSLLLVSRIAASEASGGPSLVHYEPSLGFGVHLRFPVARWLQVGAYFGGAEVGLDFAPGALGLDSAESDDALTTAWFGTKLYPTLHLGELVRVWGSVGVGWGRYEYPALRATDDSGRFRVEARGNSFVEFPVGLGGAVELIDDWLALELELVVLPTLHRTGSSFVGAPAIDANGQQRDVGPFPRSPLGFVQSLGLSVLL